MLMDEEKARLEGEDCLPRVGVPITWDDYMQGEGDEVTSLLRCPIIVSHWRPLAHKAACVLSIFV